MGKGRNSAHSLKHRTVDDREVNMSYCTASLATKLNHNIPSVYVKSQIESSYEGQTEAAAAEATKGGFVRNMSA